MAYGDYEDEDEDENEKDKYDQALERFFHDNVTITDSDILDVLHKRYSGENKNITGYRGLLFQSKVSTERFYESLGKDLQYSNDTISSISLNKDIAEGFSTTQKTYNDMFLAKRSMDGLKNGEWVSGHEGALITLEFNGSDCIDLSRAGFSCENEMLLLPNTKAKVTQIEKKIPFRRQFDEHMTSIDQILINEKDLSSPTAQYMLNNYLEQMTDNQIKIIFDLAQIEHITNEISKDWKTLAKEAQQTGDMFVSTKEIKRLYEKNPRYDHTFAHPNGIVLYEFKTERRWGDKESAINSICTFNSVPYIHQHLAECNMLNKDQLENLTKHFDKVCDAIIDLSEQPEFTYTQVSERLNEDLRNYASPIKLAIVSDILKRDNGEKLKKINDKFSGLSNASAINEATKQIEFAMEDLLRNLSTGKIMNNRPKPKM